MAQGCESMRKPSVHVCTRCIVQSVVGSTVSATGEDCDSPGSDPTGAVATEPQDTEHSTCRLSRAVVFDSSFYTSEHTWHTFCGPRIVWAQMRSLPTTTSCARELVGAGRLRSASADDAVSPAVLSRLLLLTVFSGTSQPFIVPSSIVPAAGAAAAVALRRPQELFIAAQIG